MKKKVLLIGTCIVLGVALLFTTAFASRSANAGYETYKQAIKNMASMESFTGKVQATIKDNGTMVAEIDSTVKADHKDGKELMSSNTYAKTDKDEKTVQAYVQDGKLISKSSTSDIYYVHENENRNMENRREEHMNPERMKDAERVLDAMVGNLQNYMLSSSKADGSSTITMQLDDSQIPAVVNAVTSMGIKGIALEGDKVHRGFDYSKNPEEAGLNLDANMPKLVENIKVNSVNLVAEVGKDGKLQKQTLNVVVSGTDKDGKAHQVELQLIMDITDVNHTTPDTIDLTGKNVKLVKPEVNEYNK